MLDIIFQSAAGVVCYLLRTPLFWWASIISSFCLIEKFDLGVHFPQFRWSKKGSNAEIDVSMLAEAVDGETGANYHTTNGCIAKGIKGQRHLNGVNGVKPNVLYNFVQKRLIPTFRCQSLDPQDGPFSVLLLSQNVSLQDMAKIKFKLVTFNGVPLVDPSRPMYPKSYRYENYVVARPDQADHPVAMIMKDTPNLLEAYGKRERCYIRSPVPNYGLLYSRTMPCSTCAKCIVTTLQGVCRIKLLVVYSRTDESEKVVSANRQTLTDAGFAVIQVKES